MARLRKSRRFIGAADAHLQMHRAQSGSAAADFFSLEPSELFASAAPLEVELGAGKGDFILELARQSPHHNFLAVELGGSVFQWLAIRVGRSGLSNLRAVRADARPVVNLLLPAASVHAFHVYFPDPWPKARHSKHRLLSAALIRGLARCLEPGGKVYLATDVKWYFDHAAVLFAEHGFRIAEEHVPGAAKTNFGRRFATAGKAIHAGCFKPVDQLAVHGHG